MTDPAATSSAGGQGAPAAAGSVAVPSFSSFPDIFGASASASTSTAQDSNSRRGRDPDDERRRKRERSRSRSPEGSGKRSRDRSRSREREHDREKRAKRREDKERTREREREREHDSRRDKDKRRDRSRDRSQDRDRTRDKERERDSDRARRDRRRDKDRDYDDGRRHRDERNRDRDRDRDRDRPRERDRDERRKEIEDRRERERRKAEKLATGEDKGKGRGKAEEGKEKADDGVPWYESSSKPRAEYEASYDPVAPGVAFVDTVGDKDVLRYAATSSFSTPRYRRDKGGRVLGLSEGLRVVHDRDRMVKGVQIAPLGRPYIPRYSSAVIDNTATRHMTRILLKPSGEASDMTESFTPFDTIRARADDDDLPAYRAITAGEDSDAEELAAVRAALGKVSTLEEDVRARTAAFERVLREDPGDVDKWLAYSKLHLALSPDVTDQTKQPTTRANAEVTLSILAKALDHVPNFASARLHAAYLRAAEVFWPPGKVTERWQNVTRTLGERGTPEEDMMGLYLGYIAWREGQGIGQSSGVEGQAGKGGVDEVVEVFLDCLHRLNTGTVRDQEAREENQVYLVLRACLFLKQAGFTERALAVFQALLEVTFFKPSHLRPPAPPFDRAAWFRGVLEEFEDFWDSEVPRLGEPGALGWAETHASRERVPAMSVPTHSHEPSASSDPYRRWAEDEEQAQSSSTLPGRVTDLDAPDDDPFHFVIFSDVRPFLFPIQTPIARLQLIYAFFSFLGLPFAPPDVPTNSASATDPHLTWAVGDNASLRASFWPPRPARRIMWTTVGGEPMQPEDPRMRDPFACPVKSWMSERGTLFARHWFRDLGPADLAHVDVPYARNVLTMLRPSVPDPSFVLATFAFEAAVSPKAAIKLAKTILSTERDNLALWDGYARLEWQRGKVPAARQVYVTALQAVGQQESTDDNLALDESDLWAAWAAMEFEEDEARCLKVLVMAAGSRAGLAQSSDPNHVPTRPSAVALLKAKRYYSSPTTASGLALAALYTVLTDGIQAVCDNLTAHIAALPTGHPQAEETYQLLTHIIFIHTGRHATPASLARNVLESATTAFPNNTTFLSLFLWGEAGGRVYGRVHSLVTRLTSEDDKEGENASPGAVALLWSVWAEASGATAFWNGGADRVRRALDRGVNTSTGSRSATLWRLYIEFEVLQGRGSTAKALLYRALASNGAAKVLYLLAFTTLRDQFQDRELRALADLMAERGVRLRIPTDAFWDDVDTEEEDSDEEGGDRGDYEYGHLRDREELKPY